MSIENSLPAVRSELFGGRGTVRVWSLLDAAGPFTAVLWCELAPDGSVGRHVQEEFAEIVVGVEGQGEATVDGHRHGLSAGDAVYLPLGSILTIENRSQAAPLRYLIVKARG